MAEKGHSRLAQVKLRFRCAVLGGFVASSRKFDSTPFVMRKMPRLAGRKRQFCGRAKMAENVRGDSAVAGLPGHGSSVVARADGRQNGRTLLVAVARWRGLLGCR